ncbi:hypothetical protein ACFQX6_05130 [Streptosporangium lutulentum]
MPGDVADRQQDLLGGQDERVVPVAPYQVFLLGWPVAYGDVQAERLDGASGAA